MAELFRLVSTLLMAAAINAAIDGGGDDGERDDKGDADERAIDPLLKA